MPTSNCPSSCDPCRTASGPPGASLVNAAAGTPLVKVVLRLAEVAVVCGRHAVVYVVLAPWRRPEARRRLLARRVARLCETLGGGILKAGQILAVRRDVVSLEMSLELKALHDDVAPVSADAVHAELRRAYGPRLHEWFEDISAAPIAAGGVAQVHVAKLTASRQTVALKIRRPGISRTLSADSAAIAIAGWCLEAIVPGVPFRAIAADVTTALLEQGDFEREADTQEMLRCRLDEEHVVIPRVVRGLCRDNVLVMEFLDGLRRIDDDDSDIDGHRHAIRAALRALYRMLFHEGRFHGDLHAGNLLVDERGRVVLLDFGFCGSLSAEGRADFRDFFLSIALNRGSHAAAILLRTASHVPDTLDRLGFELDVMRLIRTASQKSAGQFGVGPFAGKLFALQNRYGVVGSSNFSLAILSLLVFEGTAIRRYPELDFQSEAIEFVGGPGVTGGR